MAVNAWRLALSTSGADDGAPRARGASIRLKMLMPAIIALGLLLTVGIVAISVAGGIRDRAALTYSDDLVGTGQVNELSRLVFAQWTTVVTVSADPIIAKKDAVLAAATALDAELERSVIAIRTSDTDKKQVNELAAFEAEWATFKPLHERALGLMFVPATFAQGRSLVAGDLTTSFSALESSVTALVESKKQSAAEANSANEHAFVRGRNLIVGLTLLSVVAALALALILSGRLATAVRSIAQAARALASGQLDERAAVVGRDEVADMAMAFNGLADQLEAARDAELKARTEGIRQVVAEYQGFARRVAQGDLTARVTAGSDTELGLLAGDLNTMVAELAELSGQVRTAAAEMADASTAILAVVSQHSAATSEQAASIAETSVTVDEVRATAEQASTRAEEVADRAQDGLAVADEGAAAVVQIEHGMGDLRNRVDAIAAGMQRLAERSNAIGVITQTVSELADQSNMLALNATIEAAKAGEQGKGFAVVADEVRMLAEQSKRAVAQVQGILTEIAQATKEAEQATADGTAAAQAGVERARRAGESITRMADTMRETAMAATAIAASVREQHVGMSQIGGSMQDVSTTTNQIAAGANDIQGAAHRLREVGERLASLTSRYVVDAREPVASAGRAVPGDGVTPAGVAAVGFDLH